MIVRNPTGGTIIYSFASLTLSAGQSAEIDDSFIENVDFQLAKEAGTISVIEYEKDPVSHNVQFTIFEDETLPSAEQKGAMVAANSPSAVNPFLTQDEFSTNDVRVIHIDQDTIHLEGVNSKNIWVANDKRSVTSNIPYAINTDFAIDALGASTAALFPISTIGYLYFSGNNNPEGDDLLRPSTQAPAFYVDGQYLNSNRNWKFVGWFKTNALRQLENITYVVSNFNTKLRLFQPDIGTGTYTPTAGAVYETVASFDIFQIGNAVNLRAKIYTDSTVASEQVDVRLSGDENSFLSGSLPNAGIFFEFVTGGEQTFNLELRGPNTNHSMDLDASKIDIVFES